MTGILELLKKEADIEHEEKLSASILKSQQSDTNIDEATVDSTQTAKADTSNKSTDKQV